jgi:hypothetical protein
VIELLWIRDVERRPVRKPSAILTAAPMKIVRDWQQRNQWCATVPFTVFGGFDLMPMGDVFNENPRDPIPWRCENAPAHARDAFVNMADSFPDLDPRERAWELYKIAARVVAQTVAPIGEPVWVLAADADSGILAITAADARCGKVAAIAGSAIDLIGASYAAEMSVNVGVADFVDLNRGAR